MLAVHGSTGSPRMAELIRVSLANIRTLCEITINCLIPDSMIVVVKVIDILIEEAIIPWLYRHRLN